MKSRKLILTIAISAVIILAACFVYALSPTIRNVSKEPALQVYLNRPLELKTAARIVERGKGEYNLIPYTLVSLKGDLSGKPVTELPVNSVVQVRQFKTYTNNLGSGFTYLYALGDYKQEDGTIVNFAYDMGVVNKDLYEAEPYRLGLTVWQDSTMKPIELSKP